MIQIDKFVFKRLYVHDFRDYCQILCISMTLSVLTVWSVCWTDGGLAEIAVTFDITRIMYGFCSIKEPTVTLPRYVLINWVRWCNNLPSVTLVFQTPLARALQLKNKVRTANVTSNTFASESPLNNTCTRAYDMLPTFISPNSEYSYYLVSAQSDFKAATCDFYLSSFLSPSLLEA